MRLLLYTKDAVLAAAAARQHCWEAQVVCRPQRLMNGLQAKPELVVVDSAGIEEQAVGLLQLWSSTRPEAEPDGEVVHTTASRLILLRSEENAANGPCKQLARAAATVLLREEFAGAPARVLETLRTTEDSLVSGTEGQDPTGAEETVTGGHSTPADFGSHLIAVASPKGGVGKTFIAVNLAELISTAMRGNTLLLDLDLYGGDAAAALDVLEGPTINDLLPHAGGLSAELLRANCRETAGGLNVVAGPDRIELAELITPDFIDELLQVARHTFTYVVVDTPPDPGNDLLYELLERASRFILVSSHNSLSLRRVRVFLELVGRLGLDVDSRIEVVVNMYSGDSPVSSRGAEELLGRQPTCRIEDAAYLVAESMLEGVPLVRMAPEHPAVESLKQLAQRFSPVETNGQHRPSWHALSAAARRLLSRIPIYWRFNKGGGTNDNIT